MRGASHHPPLPGHAPSRRAAAAPAAATPRDVLIGRPLPMAEPPAQFWDEVLIEAQVQELQRLRDEIASLPDIRPSVVSRLRQEIESGANSIDALRIADELLREFVG